MSAPPNGGEEAPPVLPSRAQSFARPVDHQARASATPQPAQRSISNYPMRPGPRDSARPRNATIDGSVLNSALPPPQQTANLELRKVTPTRLHAGTVTGQPGGESERPSTRPSRAVTETAATSAMNERRPTKPPMPSAEAVQATIAPTANPTYQATTMEPLPTHDAMRRPTVTTVPPQSTFVPPPAAPPEKKPPPPTIAPTSPVPAEDSHPDKTIPMNDLRDGRGTKKARPVSIVMQRKLHPTHERVVFDAIEMAPYANQNPEASLGSFRFDLGSFTASMSAPSPDRKPEHDFGDVVILAARKINGALATRTAHIIFTVMGIVFFMLGMLLFGHLVVANYPYSEIDDERYVVAKSFIRRDEDAGSWFNMEEYFWLSGGVELDVVEIPGKEPRLSNSLHPAVAFICIASSCILLASHGTRLGSSLIYAKNKYFFTWVLGGNAFIQLGTIVASGKFQTFQPDAYPVAVIFPSMLLFMGCALVEPALTAISEFASLPTLEERRPRYHHAECQRSKRPDARATRDEADKFA